MIELAATIVVMMIMTPFVNAVLGWPLALWERRRDRKYIEATILNERRRRADEDAWYAKNAPRVQAELDAIDRENAERAR
jgi:hypothetical protein